MPTVTELYQAITTGTQLTVPNPNLKPEHANSYELAAECKTDGQPRAPVAVPRRHRQRAAVAIGALVAGFDHACSALCRMWTAPGRKASSWWRSQNDVFFDGLDLSGSLTYVNGRTVKDTAFPAAVGKFIPQLPKLRGEAVATYHVDDDALALTLAGRYSDRSFGTIDNSDPDLPDLPGLRRLSGAGCPRPLSDGTTIGASSAGVDNLNNDKYFLFHPFPQRTFVMEIHYAQ